MGCQVRGLLYLEGYTSNRPSQESRRDLEGSQLERNVPPQCPTFFWCWRQELSPDFGARCAASYFWKDTLRTGHHGSHGETSKPASLRGTCLLSVLCFFGAGDRNLVLILVPGARPLISGRIHFEQAITGVTARPRSQPA